MQQQFSFPHHISKHVPSEKPYREKDDSAYAIGTPRFASLEFTFFFKFQVD